MTERPARTPCPGCGGVRGPRGSIHLKAECPYLPVPYTPREVTVADRRATLATVIAQLLDLVDELGLHAPARSAWPDDGLDAASTPAERTLADQLRIARRALRRLDPQHPLIAEISSVLLHRPAAGFQAPDIIRLPEPPAIVPPWPIHLAIQRLVRASPKDAPLTRPQFYDSVLVAKDRRLVELWKTMLEQG